MSVRSSVWLVLAGLAACGSSHHAPGHGGDPGADSDGGGLPPTGDDAMRDAATGEDRADAGAPRDAGDGERGSDSGDGDGASCAWQSLDKHKRSDVMWLVDRSNSMIQDGRWDFVRAAAATVSANHSPDLRLGLLTFPGGSADPGGGDCTQDCQSDPDPITCLTNCLDQGNVDACRAGQVDVGIADDNAQTIQDTLSNLQPAGGTPTADSLRVALGYFISHDSAEQRPEVAVLITDGQANCPNAGGAADATAEQLAADHDLTVHALDALRDAHVRTYVVGVTANDVESVLAAYATHGDSGQPHLTGDQDSLVQALERVSREIAGCTFELAGPLAEQGLAAVELDGKALSADAADGFTVLGNTTLRLEGAACAALQDASEHQLRAQPRCP